MAWIPARDQADFTGPSTHRGCGGIFSKTVPGTETEGPKHHDSF